jgi:hypothetical protein
VIDKTIQILAVATAPTFFWAAGTLKDVILKNPDPFEDLWFMLIAAYLYYGPIFLGSAMMYFILSKKLPVNRSLWNKIIADLLGGISVLPFFAIAHFAVDLPLVAWPFVILTGFIMGTLLKLGASFNSAQSITVALRYQ